MPNDQFQTYIEFKDTYQLKIAVVSLLSCDHPHHFLVHRDDHRLWCSYFAMECLAAEGSPDTP